MRRREILEKKMKKKKRERSREENGEAATHGAI